VIGQCHHQCHSTLCHQSVIHLWYNKITNLYYSFISSTKSYPMTHVCMWLRHMQLHSIMSFFFFNLLSLCFVNHLLNLITLRFILFCNLCHPHYLGISDVTKLQICNILSLVAPSRVRWHMFVCDSDTCNYIQLCHSSFSNYYQGLNYWYKKKIEREREIIVYPSWIRWKYTLDDGWKWNPETSITF